MKRVLADLTDEECVIVYQKLSTDNKRAVLKQIYKEDQEITVYLSPSQLRDILNVVIRFVDLQTWGRMHRACKLFNDSIQPLPDMVRLNEIFSRITIKSKDLVQWRSDARLARMLCESYFTACSRRLIQYAHSLRGYGFDLDVAMIRARPKTPSTCYGMFLPFGKSRQYLIEYPYGHIVTKDNKPLGNIFTVDWRDNLKCPAFGKLRFDGFRDMDAKRKKRYYMQKAQLEYYHPKRSL